MPTYDPFAAGIGALLAAAFVFPLFRLQLALMIRGSWLRDKKLSIGTASTNDWQQRMATIVALNVAGNHENCLGALSANGALGLFVLV